MLLEAVKVEMFSRRSPLRPLSAVDTSLGAPVVCWRSLPEIEWMREVYRREPSPLSKL